MPKGRDDRCEECGIFDRRIETPDGEARLCLNCSDDDVIAAVTDLREALDLDPRDDACAFAFGIAVALDTESLLEWGYQSPARDAETVAAACVYLGSILAGDKIDQPTIAEAAGITPLSIRKTYNEYYEDSGFADAYGPIDRGELNPTDPHPAIDIDGWRDHLEAQDVSGDAVKTDVSNVRRFAVWYDDEGEPEPGDVAAWLAQLAGEGYASRTIENRYDSLRRYFEWAGLGELKVRRRA